ncbi:hypothetical protein B0H11DRAFT_541318 [Mycena galericulata]|nr:hypothetical protein B0H11DRAFT_541318 [Mycena galericulata]
MVPAHRVRLRAWPRCCGIQRALCLGRRAAFRRVADADFISFSKVQYDSRATGHARFVLCRPSDALSSRARRTVNTPPPTWTAMCGAGATVSRRPVDTGAHSAIVHTPRTRPIGCPGTLSTPFSPTWSSAAPVSHPHESIPMGRRCYVCRLSRTSLSFLVVDVVMSRVTALLDCFWLRAAPMKMCGIPSRIPS